MHQVFAAVRRQWRWVLVGVGIVVLVALPALFGAVPARRSETGVDALASRILASADQPYQGYAESRGGLRLPELPGAADLSTLISDTARMRLWYDGPDQWRTDLLYSGGERDRYGTPDGIWTWDSGNHRAAFLDHDESQLRLPLPIDLTPPDLARRLLEAASPDEISAIAPRRVAGLEADGLRITPSTPVSTVDTIDIWADPSTGLPVWVEVTAKGKDRPSLQSGFLDLELARPDQELVTFEAPPDSETSDGGGDALDLVQAIERYSETKLPDTIAGLPRRTETATAAATYGEGLGAVAVLALPEQFVTDTLRALPTSEREWGQTAALVRTPLVNGMIFAVDGTAFIVAGPVTFAELDRVAEDIVAQDIS